MLRIAIVDPSDATREPLRAMLLGVDFVWLEAESKQYEFFADVIQQNAPDLVIVSMDSDRGKALSLTELLAHEYPRLPILAISDDHQTLLSALKKGAKYFLTRPVVLEDLLTALGRVSESTEGSAPSRGTGGHRPQTQAAQITAILGSRGGVGCTTLAVNLGATLASDPNCNTALIDLDLALGDADVALDLLADHTMTDLVMNIDKLDMTFIKRSLIKHEPTGLSVLCHPLQISEIDEIHPDHLQRILSLLKVSYNHLVLDLSKTLRPTDVVALQAADKILLVAQLELSSLRNVVRVLHALSAHEDLAAKVHVVVNRVGGDYTEGEISLKKAEETIGKPIFWQVPNDVKAVMGARSAGVPLLQFAPKCRAQQSIHGLAATLGSKAPAPQPQAIRRGWFK